MLGALLTPVSFELVIKLIYTIILCMSKVEPNLPAQDNMIINHIIMQICKDEVG